LSTLLEHVAKEKKPIKLMKVDALMLLRGATALSRYTPMMLIVELSIPKLLASQCVPKLFLSSLLSLSYVLQVLPRHGLTWNANRKILTELDLDTLMGKMHPDSEMDIVCLVR
jgi:hypothetical protein